MNFVPLAVLRHALDQLRAVRMRSLRGVGYSRRHAVAVADKEFAEYDVLEIDDQGYVRVEGLENLNVTVRSHKDQP